MIMSACIRGVDYYQFIRNMIIILMNLCEEQNC